MSTEPITIRVDPEAARVFNEASPEDRRKLEILLNLRLLDAMQSTTSLRDTMRAISARAQERGLTEERLQELLGSE